MELSEAKETLKNIKRCCFDDEQYQKYGFMEQYIDISDVEAIDTVLKALHEDELIIDRVKNIKDRLAYDITYNWDNARDDLRRMLGV